MLYIFDVFMKGYNERMNENEVLLVVFLHNLPLERVHTEISIVKPSQPWLDRLLLLRLNY